MTPQYAINVVREPWALPVRGEVARYLRWEYGEGTGVGFLESLVPRSRRPRAAGSRFIERLRGISTAVRTRVVAALTADLQPALSLVAEWKRGRLETMDLVVRLEELELEAGGPGPDPCP